MKCICLNCMTILESKNVHDFQQCECENESFIDGGEEYSRLGGVNPNLVVNITKEELKYQININQQLISDLVKQQNKLLDILISLAMENSND